MMQSEIGIPPAEAMRSGQGTLSPGQKQIVDRLLAKTDTGNLTPAEVSNLTTDIDDTGSLPVREADKSPDVAVTEREKVKIDRTAPGWPDSPRVISLASIVREVLEQTDDIPPEEDFTTMLLQKLEEAGLDTSAPIVDFYA